MSVLEMNFLCFDNNISLLQMWLFFVLNTKCTLLKLLSKIGHGVTDMYPKSPNVNSTKVACVLTATREKVRTTVKKSCDGDQSGTDE